MPPLLLLLAVELMPGKLVLGNFMFMLPSLLLSQI
jgi:hypothetical protein